MEKENGQRKYREVSRLFRYDDDELILNKQFFQFS